MKEEINIEQILWLFCNIDMGIGENQEEIMEFIKQQDKTLQAEQQAHNDLREKLKGIQWSGTHVESDRSRYACCPACDAIEDEWTGGERFENTNHYSICWLAQAIKEDSK